MLRWMVERIFKYMESTETVSFANIIEIECLWYWFSIILQNDLNLVKDHWNTLRVCKSRFQTIHGRLNVLYEIPSRSGGQEGLNLTILDEMFDQSAPSITEEEYPEDYQEYFSYLMQTLNDANLRLGKRHYRCS